MMKKILGLAATAALALGATSAQAVSLLDIGTVTGPDQGLDIPNLTLGTGSFTDTYKFTVNSAVDLRLESSVSYVSYTLVNPFAVTLSLCTDSSCSGSSVIGTYDDSVNNSRTYFQAPIANGTYMVTVSGNVSSGSSNRYSGQANFFNVPEPATMGLFGLGLAAVGLVRRRRKA